MSIYGGEISGYLCIHTTFHICNRYTIFIININIINITLIITLLVLSSILQLAMMFNKCVNAHVFEASLTW